MNKQDLIRLRSKIVAMLATLEVTASNARSTLRESSEVNPNCLQDESDAGKGEVDLKNTLTVHNHATAQQKLLRNALVRMERGGYGVCQECEEEIGLRRLNAMPGATLCIHCQEAHELGFAPEPKIITNKNHVQVRWAA